MENGRVKEGVEVGRGREEMRKGNDELLRKHFQALTLVRVSLKGIRPNCSHAPE